MNEWYTGFYIILDFHNDSLEQKWGGGQIGNKHQADIKSTKAEQKAVPFAGFFL